jgi:hypothetical protein
MNIQTQKKIVDHVMNDIQKYHINTEWIGHHGELISFDGYIKINSDVINSVDDGWRKMFYSGLTTPQKIADHIAFNMIVNNAKLSMLDGFANFSDSYAIIIDTDTSVQWTL